VIDERRVFERFHEALDVEPRPGAYERLQTALAKNPVSPRRWPQSVFRRPETRVAIAGWVAVFLAVALATVFLAARLYAPITVKPPTVTPPPGGGNSQAVGWVKFITPQDGMVITQGSLLVTHDAGRHWQLSLAQGPDANGFTFVRFVDPQQIVVLTGEPMMSETLKGTLILHVTTDGGAHWVSNPIAAATVSGIGDWTYVGEETYFINAREGWQLGRFYLDVCDVAPPAEHSGHDATDVQPSPCPTTHGALKATVIYRTADSGAHWAEVARVDTSHPTSHGLKLDAGTGSGSFAFATNLVFVDSEHGYVTVREADSTGRLYVSQDGGTNWARADLPAPPGGWGGTSGPVLTTLTFFDQHGVVEVRMASGARYTYTTSDSGLTWANAHRVPGEDNYGNLAFADADHWWLYDGSSLSETVDAGATWRPVKTRLPAAGDRLVSISATGDVLWATVAPASACDPSNLAECNFLIRSDDGGITWSVVRVATG
jgi:photosystem II stability/assembly factor-like uncharacterized protein